MNNVNENVAQSPPKVSPPIPLPIVGLRLNFCVLSHQTEVLPLVEVVARGGGSCCVMAYGATGSGKTHTLTGAGVTDVASSPAIPS